MTQTHSKIIRIDPAQQNLSKEQARFNSLIKKIEKLKQQLREWQETLPRYQQRVGGEYHDLLATFNSHRLEFIRLLDEAYAD
ncbi:MAG: DnaJ domain-containing protein, partial [Halothiobacillaceae bacterium]